MLYFTILFVYLAELHQFDHRLVLEVILYEQKDT